MEFFRFHGDPCEWPDIIQIFETCINDKPNFRDSDGEAKGTVTTIEENGIFYAAAPKNFEPNFGEPQFVTFLNLKSVLDLPQFSTNS